MPCFRAAATWSEARKTKGDWIVPAHLAVPIAPPKKFGKRVGFLDLPGELRNQIYGLYFSRGFRVEITSKRRIDVVEPPKFILVNPFLSNRKRAKIIDKQPESLTLRISRPLFKNKAPVKPAIWATSFSGLFLVCRQLYLETIKYHYAKTAFSFETMSSFGGFLTRVDELNMAAIKSLELHHHSYGEPHHTKDVVWKQKYDARWQSLCRRAALQFQGLRSLKINLYVVETPLCFELHAPWVQPLLEFQSFDRVQQNRGATAGIDIQVRITTRCEKLGSSAAADIHPDLIHAYENLRDLFQEAVTHAMHGWNHEDAMFKYRDTFRSQYLRWIHHLNLNEPGSILESGD